MPRATDYKFKVGNLDFDDLQVLRFTATEGISQCFSYDIEMATFELDGVSFDNVIGEPGHLEIHTMYGQRHVDGIVVRWEEVGHNRAITYFNARLVPRLWTLTLTRQSRIFQKMSTPDILKKVLEGADIPSNMFRFSFKGSYEPRAFCVQYRETDYEFISRLMEEEGMFFFFEHTEEGHTLVVGDSPDVHAELPEDAILRYRETDAGMLSEETITHLRFARTLRSGAVTLKEFDFKKPALALKAENQASSDKETKFEVYDYPGEYHIQGLGDRLARVRLEEERAETLLGVGETDCRRFEAGFKFTMEDFPRDEFNTELVIVRVRHIGEQPHAGFGGAGGSGDDKQPVYRGIFECIPLATPYRPPRITPRPRIDGPQTATVVGPKGEEIHCDEHGRIKLKFHWDRSDAKDDSASPWIRVSQPWGGAGYGGMMIPRVGQEVVVEFLEGDPDRPIVTGRVYNGENPPPYELPGGKTITALKSSSSPGGSGANEIRFEDKKDDEQFLVQAEKDLDQYVKNDQREWVGNDQHVTVARDRLTKIVRDDHLLVERDSLSDVTRDFSLKVGGKQMIEIEGTRTLKIKGDVHESSEGAFSQAVKGDLYLKGKNIVIEAGTTISFKVGGNFITIDSGGVTLKGSMLKLNSGGAAGNGKAVTAVPTVKPQKATMAKNAVAAEAGAKSSGSSSGGSSSSKSRAADRRPTHKDPPKDAPQDPAKKWLEILLQDEHKNPIPGEPYEVELPDKSVTSGTTGADGVARIEGVEPGSAKVRFPRLDKSAWKKA